MKGSEAEERGGERRLERAVEVRAVRKKESQREQPERHGKREGQRRGSELSGREAASTGEELTFVEKKRLDVALQAHLPPLTASPRSPVDTSAIHPRPNCPASLHNSENRLFFTSRIPFPDTPRAPSPSS